MSVEFVTSAQLPTEFGDFEIHAFMHEGQEHLVLSRGKLDDGEPVLARVHSECLTGDGLFSMRCDCGPQLAFALNEINERNRGMIVYLRQEGRGIGLVDKIKAYSLQDKGDDTYTANLKLGHAADMRSYSMLKDVFAHFGVKKLDLMTNNPEKIEAIQEAGIEIVNRIPIKPGRNPHNHDYIQTKAQKFKHL